jgi:hypothetical protein
MVWVERRGELFDHLRREILESPGWRSFWHWQFELKEPVLAV